MMIAHGYVPDNFGAGVLVPLIKDKAGDINSLDNYRPTTLTPIIAKLFEVIAIDMCSEKFVSDELQFGFKRGFGCRDAIFVLKSVVNYYNVNKSSVFAAALDISKAFDKVCHNKLIVSLQHSGIPYYFIVVIANWYAKLSAVVRWNSALSKIIAVKSGVRQGGVLSPSIFNVFINAIITNLRLADVGCHIHGSFVGCLLYADDIILLSESSMHAKYLL
jgi:hypothetical protein